MLRTIVTCLSLLGGGVALLYAAKGLESLPTVNEDQKRGVKIIQNALKVLFVEFPQPASTLVFICS